MPACGILGMRIMTPSGDTSVGSRIPAMMLVGTRLRARRCGILMRMAELVGRHRIMMLGPIDAGTGRPTVVVDIAELEAAHLDLLRRLLEPNLGAGIALVVDGQVVARGADPPERASLPQVQRLTEMAVQQHEYLCAELRRMRDEYEQDFAQERAILRTLRERWLERVCDDQVHGEDAIRYFVESLGNIGKKVTPPSSAGG
jgi:hypothetical protein